MTPQEQQLVAELFDRLSQLENAPRDPDAERLIADGARRAPHALYALVQTALVQDEALKRANVRIQELQQQLQAQTGGEQPQQRQGSFLDNMRDAVFGQGAARGSVPNAQPPSAGSANQSQTGYAPPRAAPAAAAPYPAQPAYPAGAGAGFAPAGGAFGGGSFLGTAASVAAGAVGGGLLLDGIRSMFSHHSGSGGNDPYAFGVPGDEVPPWRGDVRNDDFGRQTALDPANQSGDPDLTQASDEQFVDDDNFDTADSGPSDDDSYDV